MSDELSQKVKVAQAQILLNNVKTNVIATIVTASIVLLMLNQQAPSDVLIPWYLVFLIVTVARFIHVLHLEKTSLTSENLNQTLYLLALLTVVSAAMWGSLGVVYISADSPIISLILLMIYTGLVANASATMASVIPLYLCFVLPILVPAAYQFYAIGENRYIWIALLIVVYFTVSWVATSRIRSTLRQSVLLRYENLDLIDSLQLENSKTEKALLVAEQANIAKSRFFAAANHDLRQPLQSLSMFTTTLSAQVESPDQRKIVSHMDSSIQSLAGLFNALLDISSLDAGTLKLNKQHFDLKPLISNLAIELVELSNSKQLSLTIEVDDVVVYTDPLLLSRIVRNLVNNAVHYTHVGGVTLSARRVNNNIVLSVADTGRGIPAEQKERIFDEFVQLNNPGRDRSKGLGLGLSIVRRICQLLNMTLKVESVEGVGSEFIVEMPMGDTAEVVTPKVSNVVTPYVFDGLFVLVIDDEEEIQLSMEGLLSEWGCTVMVSGSGKEAVKQLVEYESCPHAVISDYRLQNNETGEQALRMVNEHCGYDVPAIIITGDIAPERLVEIDKLNLPVLHKPCNALQLQSYLYSILATAEE